MSHIGVLAIQGDFDKHRRMLQKLGQQVSEVRTAAELNMTDALIIPGGESTTLVKFFHDFGLGKAIQHYAADHPVMGTCAGLIVLAQSADHLPYRSLNLIDLTVKRNAYGRQRESFTAEIQLSLNGTDSGYQGVFIRAPKIDRCGKTIRILGQYNGEVVMAASGTILVCTFHPELTDDARIHKFFLDAFVTKKTG
jgi:5'-phosphate synthase pdxT subunit